MSGKQYDYMEELNNLDQQSDFFRKAITLAHGWQRMFEADGDLFVIDH